MTFSGHSIDPNILNRGVRCSMAALPLPPPAWLMDNTPRVEQVVMLLKQPHAVDGETALHMEVLTAIKRPFSTLQKARITTPTRQFQVYIKQYHLKHAGKAHREMMMARVARDYQITQLLYKRFSVFPELNVPRPLVCFPELLNVVFEESPGENLLAFIQRTARGWPSQRRLRQLLSYCALCGEWLRRFQQLFPSPRHYSIAEMGEYVDHRLRQLVAQPQARFPESLCQQVRRYFDRLEARSQSLDLRMAAAHSDFCPSNMLVDRSGVTAIDLAMFGEGSIYQDPVQFYHQLDLLLIKPTFRPRVIRQLQHAFLTGYDAHFDTQNPMFEAFRLQHMTTHFSGVLKIPDLPLHTRWYNRLVCRHHRRWIERLSST